MTCKPATVLLFAAMSFGLAPAAQADGTNKDLAGLLRPGDQLLAFKQHDLDSDGVDDAVAIVRRADPDASGNTCEIVVLRHQQGGWTATDHSNGVVDCLYNDIARNARDLSDNLTVASGTITYVNDQLRGNVTFTLKYDVAKTAWYLAEASSAAPHEDLKSGDMLVDVGVARYPDDLPWTAMADVDPTALQEIMDAHRTIVK